MKKALTCCVSLVLWASSAQGFDVSTSIAPGTPGRVWLDSLPPDIGGSISGFKRSNTRIAFTLMAVAKTRYFAPIESSLQGVVTAKRNWQSESARKHAMDAKKMLDEFDANRLMPAIVSGIVYGVESEKILAIAKKFSDELEALKISVANAQNVASDIAFYGQQPGIKLLMEASEYSGRAYARGMRCSDLVVHAAKHANLKIVDEPTPGKTVTATWFDGGVGPDFRQIAGGEEGISLKQLVDAANSGEVRIPLGSVIVADGHAAFFAGNIATKRGDEFIVYDANDSGDYFVSITSGDASPLELEKRDLAFPGHRVGEHVTRLQWGEARRVKVFAPKQMIPQPLLRDRAARYIPGGINFAEY